MRELPSWCDRPRLTAAMGLLDRIGATDVEVGYDIDDERDATGPEQGQPDWYAKGRVHGDPHVVTGEYGPDDAAERLCRRLVNGSRCSSCARVCSLARVPSLDWEAKRDAAYWAEREVCLWTRREGGLLWERGCVDTHEEHQATKDVLGR
jgi:hypothetical protein